MGNKYFELYKGELIMDNEIMNVNRQTFDIKTLTNLIGTTAMNTNQLSKQMEVKKCSANLRTAF